MVRHVPCGVRGCKQGAVDGQERHRHHHRQEKKEEHSITEYVREAHQLLHKLDGGGARELITHSKGHKIDVGEVG
jgi:hypothetical protein